MLDVLQIQNYTPHPIVLSKIEGELNTLPSSGVARVSSTKTLVGKFGETPIYSTVFGEVEGLPEPSEGTYFIVSGMVLSACPDRTDLLAPCDLTRDKEGNVIGLESFRV